MRQLLPFKIGYETYALNLIEIQEIVENRTIYPFPAAPQAVAGVIDFHGRIVPVVDLAVLLGFPPGHIGRRLIVLVNDRGPMALGVDQVGAIISCAGAQRSTLQKAGESGHIEDIINCEGTLLNLLALDQVQMELDQLCQSEGV